MLRGHETLVRLVGKRRRLDPASVLYCIDSSSDKNGRNFMTNTSVRLGPPGKENAALSLEDVTVTGISSTSSLQGSDATWVKCPVCGKDVKGDDHSINIHLDLCLLKKPKSKSRQSTLTRFTAVITPVREPFPSEMSSSTDVKEDSDGIQLKLDVRPFRHSTSSDNLQYTKDTAISAQEFKSGARDVCHHSRKELAEVNIAVDECNCDCHRKKESLESDETVLDVCRKSTGYYHLENSNTLPLFSEESEKDIEFQHGRENNGVFILETVIVGRRFNKHAQVKENMVVSSVRERDNPSDPNAIKIVEVDNKSNATIGYLPRSLASLFSRLLDKNLLNVQGIVVKVPEAVSEPVPIRLRCEGNDLEGKKEDTVFFKETWQKIQQVVEETANGRDKFTDDRSIKYMLNFTQLLRVVLDKDSCVFNQEELAFLESFFLLSESARCLFVRLSQRKGPWFRISLINYAEIPDVEESCMELVASGFCSSADLSAEGCSVKTVKERLYVLTVPELKQVLKATNKQVVDFSILKREQLTELIVDAAKVVCQSGKSTRSEMVAASINSITGLCVRLSDTANFLLWRLQRLFFLNGEQDMSTFLLADIGATKYPSYICDQTRRAFMTRAALLSYERALGVAQAMDMAIETDDYQAIEHCISTSATYFNSNVDRAMAINECCTEDAFFQRFTAGWVYATVLTLGVSVLERDRRYSDAIRLLKQLLCQSHCPGRRGYWVSRLSIDLEHLGQKDESLEIAESGLKDPRIRNGDRIVLQRRVLRLAKPPRRWKRPSFANAAAQKYKEVFITGRPLNCKAGVKSRFYGYDDQQCGVEELALQYYAGDSGGSWRGVHSENGVWMTLFALLMWDVLFADVPNVFWHPFQNAPLDLNTDAFYPSRKSLIDEQIRKIRCGEAPELLAATWSKHWGAACRGLNWERHSLEELQVIVKCMGGCGLAAICMLLAEDYAGWAGGMPDLFLWRVSSMKTSSTSCCGGCCGAQGRQGSQCMGEAKLVEVKGPRDRLSEQQCAWIYVLMGAGIDVEVCRVQEQPKT